MSRDAGFTIADLDTGLLRDAKFRALRRDLTLQAERTEAVTLYVAVLLESWEAGERLTLDEATPEWMNPTSGVAQALITVGLLDEDGRIPEAAWNSWFVTAAERRQISRDRWKRAQANRRGRKPKPSPDDTAGSHRGVIDESAGSHRPPTVRPSVPAEPVLPAAAGATKEVSGMKPDEEKNGTAQPTNQRPRPPEAASGRKRNGVDPEPVPLADVIRGMGLTLPAVVSEPPAGPTR